MEFILIIQEKFLLMVQYIFNKYTKLFTYYFKCTAVAMEINHFIT